MGILILPLMFLALWAIVILPQQRRVRAHNALVNVLEVGDEVMTTSGILGTITALDDEVLHLEVAPAVTLRVVRGAIARKMNEPEPEPEPEVATEPQDEGEDATESDGPTTAEVDTDLDTDLNSELDTELDTETVAAADDDTT